MGKFIICGFDSENSPVEFGITIQSDDTVVISGYNNSSVTDDNEFLSCMLSDSHWKSGEIRSWSNREAPGLGHAIIQYVLHKIFGDNLWFNWVSIVKVE
jgi:hypothetical protein